MLNLKPHDQRWAEYFAEFPPLDCTYEAIMSAVKQDILSNHYTAALEQWREGNNVIANENQYGIIVVDMPQYISKNRCRKRFSARPEYEKFTPHEIVDFLWMAIPRLRAKKHNVFIWATDSMVTEAEFILAANSTMPTLPLKYQLHYRMIWDKNMGASPARTIRLTHEYLVWLYEWGNMLFPCKEMRGKYPSVIRCRGAYGWHKPDEVYEMIEKMFPTAKKIELFARKKRDGWDSWGEGL